MKKITRQQAIEEIVKACKGGKTVTVATDIKDFSWFAEGELSPHQSLVPSNAQPFENVEDDRTFVEEMLARGLAFRPSRSAGFYYISC